MKKKIWKGLLVLVIFVEQISLADETISCGILKSECLINAMDVTDPQPPYHAAISTSAHRRARRLGGQGN